MDISIKILLLFSVVTLSGCDLFSSSSAPNQSPIIDVESEQSVDEQTNVILSASASDSDGMIISYLWRQVSGGSVTLNNAATATANFIAPTLIKPETLQFSLTVTDNEGGKSKSNISVVITHVNSVPTVDVGGEQSVDEQTIVTLNGSANDSDGPIVSYLWSQTGGSRVTLNNATSLSASFISPALIVPETLVFSLTITDQEGASAQSSVSVIVNPVNLPPTLDAGSNQSVDEQTTVLLSGIANDSDGAIVSYLWTQISGDSVIINNLTSSSANFMSPALNATEVFIFLLIVTDNEGLSAQSIISIIVNPVNLTPTVDAGSNQSVDEQTNVTLNGIASDSDGTIASYF